MRGWRALDAEIFRRAHNAAAKEHLPEMIDGDAPGERMVRPGQPACERQPAARLLGARPGGLDLERRAADGAHR